MASPLLHLAALEKLAREPENLPGPLSRALVEDVEYGRFGVLLPDLPSFERPTTGLGELLGLRPNPPLFTRLLHGSRPMAVLLKAAELVARGALVGRSAGQALLSGYLVHVALDRALDGQALRLSANLSWRHGGPNGAANRVAWLQSLFLLRERFGRVPLGERELVDWMRVVKRRGMPWAGLGGGIYEITRLSLLEVYGQAPSKGQVDGWVRGLYLVSQLLGSPVGGKLGGVRSLEKHAELVYRGPGVDFPTALDRGLEVARRYLVALDALFARGDFGPRARGRFLLEVPEGDVAGSAAA
jgi:hypothetical protein